MTSILIVDDSRTARMMLKHWIKALRADAEVTEAENAENALSVAADMPDDTMAIVDYNMPGDTGISLAEKLSARFQKNRMTLCTANIQESVRKRAEDLGVFYISKPMTPVKVKKVISQMEA